MARSRSIPTNLYWDPDFSQLESEAQSILIGLTLAADDEGRGIAHLDILARQLNKQATTIERALQMLSTLGFLLCYQVGRYHYYQHARWEEWEHGLAPNKRTPSRHPAPPSEQRPEDPTSSPSASGSRLSAAFRGEPLEIPENPREPLSQEEEEENLKLNKAEEEPGSSNLITFPTSNATADPDETKNEPDVTIMTAQIAHILTLPETVALRHIVEEYHLTPGLSLLGEADMAREWIDDRQRNSSGKRMTPAFFRRWLKREHEAIVQRQATAPAERAGEHLRSHPPLSSIAATRASLASRSLMHLETEYQQAQNRKKVAHE